MEAEKELPEVLAQAQKAKHGIIDVDKFKSVIWEILSPMPNFPNGKHFGPPSLTSAECLALDAYSNPNKFDKKAIAATLGSQKGYGNLTQDKFVDLVRCYDPAKGSGPPFQALFKGSLESYLQSIGASFWRRVVLNLSTSHIQPLSS